MIGDMIAKVRKEKGITKTELARITGINIGHLTHIEKGERNPSHKALKNICKALDIPYQQLMYTYDKELNEDQETYNFIKHISYDKVPAIDKITNFIDCPSSVPSASFALKLNDNCMEPSFAKGTYLFIELNPILNNKDIEDFEYEARTKVFYNLPPLDERRRNEEILNLINNVGLSNINDTNSKKSSGKILGLFRF